MMKRNVVLFTLTMLMALCANAYTAFNAGGDRLRYFAPDTEPGNVWVVKDTKYNHAGDISVPSQVSNQGKTYTVSRLETNCFAWSEYLSSVKTPASVKSVGDNVFYYCDKLLSVLFEGVETIGRDVFDGCTSMNTLEVRSATPPTCDGNPFSEIQSHCTLIVPKGTKGAYAANSVWGKFAAIKENGSVSVDPTSVEISPKTIEIAEGATYALTATVSPSNAYNTTVKWESDDPSVAKVDGSGIVTGVKEGKTTVKATTVNNLVAKCEVTVKKKASGTVVATGISLDVTSNTITPGETFTITATVTPADATDKTVSWATSNSSVATVSKGVVKGIAKGECTITAKNSAGQTATCKVTVKENVVAVTSVTLDKTSLDLKEGATATLKATVKPDNATDKSVSWSSTNESVAKVDQSGKVTAVKAGTCDIKAIAGGKSASCKVTVSTTTVEVTSISLNKTSLSLKEGEKETLEITINPSNATNKSITWTSDNQSVAKVDQSGNVTAVKAGSCTITAKSNNGKTATCKVTVTANSTTVAVTSVTLNKSSLTLDEGAAETLIATVNPSNATNKSITWTSDNQSVAKVDQSGNVTAVKAGSCKITATASNGKYATCSVTVKTASQPGGDYYVYLDTNGYWDKPYVWSWNNASPSCCHNTTWPGDPMEKVSGVQNLWKWTAPAGQVPTMIIFSNNKDPKTADLTYVNGGTYILDDKNGNYVFLPTRSEQTDVESISVDDMDAEYYTISGIRISNPARGLYLRRTGNKVEKIFIK